MLHNLRVVNIIKFIYMKDNLSAMNPHGNLPPRDSDILIGELKGIELKLGHNADEFQIESYDGDRMLYSKLESALSRIEIWSPLLREQIDICKELGTKSLYARQDIKKNFSSQDDVFAIYYTLYASSSLVTLRLNKDKDIVTHFGKKITGKMYTLLLTDHEIEKVYGHDRFKTTIKLFCYDNPEKELIYLSAICRDFNTFINYEQLRNFKKDMTPLDRKNAEKMLNLLVAVPHLFMQATERLYTQQRTKLTELTKQKERVSETHIPDVF